MEEREIKVTQRSVSNQHIDVTIENGQVWRLTGVYGEPDWNHKDRTWSDLRNLYASNNAMPWILLGDFNEILYDSEKEGGNPRPQRFMQNFRDALDDCNLEDFPYIGDRFTWRRGRIRERLDRSVCNREWNDLFPLAGSVNAEMTKSDHRPILLDTEYYVGVEASNSIPIKRFEARWLSEPSVDDIVEELGKEQNQEIWLSLILWLGCMQTYMNGTVRC